MLSETEWGTEQLKLAVLAARETLPDVYIAGGRSSGAAEARVKAAACPSAWACTRFVRAGWGWSALPKVHCVLLKQLCVILPMCARRKALLMGCM